ncbi:hypothetical protein H9P43_003706 [Blastocladiella emersonii ATCC 22665]|nr:hypothetical protein H9P43_003706 [Blastocladiella emersonii ATCC 22665]
MLGYFCPANDPSGTARDVLDLPLCLQYGLIQPVLLVVHLVAIAGRLAYLRTRLALPPRAAVLANTAGWNRLLVLKSALALGVAALSLLHLVIDPTSDASALSVALRAAAYLAAAATHRAESYKSTQPSTVLTWLYLFDSAASALLLRSLALASLPSTWTAFCLVGSLSLFVLESLSVRGREYVTEHNYPPELASTLLSRTLYLWAGSLARLGGTKFLELSDLWEPPGRDQVEYGVARVRAARAARPHALLLGNLLSTFGWSWLGIAAMHVGNSLVPAASPWLLRELLRTVSEALPRDEQIQRGILLATAYLVTFAISELMGSNATAFAEYAQHRLKAVAMALVYAKSLRAPVQTDDDQAAVLNHMETDADALSVGLKAAVAYPFHITTLLISFSWLWYTVGPVAFVGIGVLVAFIPTNYLIGRVLLPITDAKMECMDRRVAATREAVLGIKTVKLSGWTELLRERIMGHRVRELDQQRRLQNVEAGLHTLFFCVPPLASLAMFATYALGSGDRPLTVELVFVTLSSVAYVKNSLFGFVWSLKPLISAATAYKRLSAFLAAPDRDEYVEQLPERGAIRVRGGTFKWASRGDGDEETAASTEPTLHDINLDIAPGSLVMVVGSVGSSKSSLLSALLGDIPLVSGTVGVGGRASYVSQRPWILNDTIRNNVTFGLAFDADQYARVVHACALDRDLAAMPLGDRTLIGERGLTLSKGQQVRLACARAAYACVVPTAATNSGDAGDENPCALLDDILGSVDVHVDHHLFEHLIEGVLRDTTRVLVTHALHHVHRADHVVVCSRGTIVEQGPPAKIMAIEGGAFAAMVREYQAKRVDAPAPPPEPAPPVPELSLVVPSPSHSAVADGDVPPSPTLSVSSITALLPDKPTAAPPLRPVASAFHGSTADESDEDEETMKRGAVGWAVYHQYLTYVGPFRALGLVVLVTLWLASEAFAMYWAGQWGSENSSNPTGSSGNAASFFGVLVALNGCIAMFLGSAYWTFGIIVVRSAFTISDRLTRHVLRLPLAFFDTAPSGRIMNRFARDVTATATGVPNSAFRVIYNSLILVVALVTVSLAAPQVLVVLLPLSLGFYYYASRFIRVGRELRRLENISMSPMYQVFSDTLDGLSTIRAHGQSARYLGIAHARINTYLRAHLAHVAVHQWLKSGLKLISFAVLFAATFLMVMFPGQGVVLIGLGLTQAQDMAWMMDELIDEVCDLEQELVAIERIQEYLDLPLEENEAVNNSAAAVDALWPADGRVEFTGYAARYRPELPLVLSDLDLSVAPGEKVCLVGRTGSGKSSTVLALLRGFEAAAGSIRIDGVDIAAVPLDVLRSRVTILPQDAFIFGGGDEQDVCDDSVGSVRANVDPYGATSDAEIWRALEAVHLADHVRSLPRGLDEPAKGALSVGQAQLLCLARAVIRKSRILILDESTANTDHTTDALVQATIREQFRDCTVICIAHRIGTVLDYDTVLYLDHGRIVERGSPRELIRQPESRFYSLAKQSGLVAEHDE